MKFSKLILRNSHDMQYLYNLLPPTFPQDKLKVLHDAVTQRNVQGIIQCIDEDPSTLNTSLEV